MRDFWARRQIFGLFFLAGLSGLMAQPEGPVLIIDPATWQQLVHPQEQAPHANGPAEEGAPGRIYPVDSFLTQIGGPGDVWLELKLRNTLSAAVEIFIAANSDKCTFNMYPGNSPPNLRDAGLHSWSRQKLLKVIFRRQSYQFIRLEPGITQELLIKYPQEQGPAHPGLWLGSKRRFIDFLVLNAFGSIVLQAVILGLLLAILLYHLIMYFINAERALLFYNFYSLSLICSFYSHPSNELFHLAGLEYSATEHGSLLLQIVSNAAMVIFYLLFCAQFVQAYNKEASIPRRLKLLAFLFLADLLAGLAQAVIWGFDYKYQGSAWLLAWRTARALFFWGAMAYLFTVIIRWILAKDRILQFLGLSSLFLIIGGMVFALLDYDIPPLFSDPANNFRFFQFTCIFQLLAFALLLSYQRHAIEKEKAALSALDEAKSRFFANISHEFRTPLTLILGPVSGLLRQDRPPKEQQQLGLIRNNAQRMLRLVNQILDLSKLEAGSMKVHPEPVELVRFSRQAFLSFSSLAESRSIQLDFEASQAEIWVVLDPDHLEKILANLLSNAIKYTPEKGRVRLAIKAGGRNVHIQVQDTGIGIREDLAGRIFDRFYQAESAGFTRGLPSTGIGLALTRELTELHGGKIEVSSKPGKGSLFSVSLPLKKVEPPGRFMPAEPSLPAEEPVPALPAEEARSGADKPLVLIIEDNADIQSYLKSILADDFQIMAADDGQAGVEKAIAQVPDLVITDVMMPKKDGFSVTEALKAYQATSHIPIIILTGRSSLESKLQGLKADADDYLAKPFDAAELKARAENLLRNRQRLQKHFSERNFLNLAREKVSSREEAFLQKVVATVEENLGNEDFTIEALGQALFMDRTQLYRKLRALTGKNPSRFIRTYRLQYARQLLEGEAGTASEIAYQVGFREISYFSRCFKEEFGYPPSEARARKGK
ncbi:MAG: response regulator [Lewinellaceae bacterium]|nr:response regulator [Phaeodactylibacter sp.]MCB9039090.1 response regulator [Lewinellaceae bacterium]